MFVTYNLVCLHALALRIDSGGSGLVFPGAAALLAKPTQFFHIRHCNCSRWPGCCGLWTHTHRHTHTHTHRYTHTHVHIFACKHMTQEPPTACSRLLTNGALCFLFFCCGPPLPSANGGFCHSLLALAAANELLSPHEVVGPPRTWDPAA